ncbi:MAG: DUF362 domain-containing protein [Bryobacteraceae bacterium]|nr:DUF362 domain-containing protein [Bryobacteraceae bacterium]
MAEDLVTRPTRRAFLAAAAAAGFSSRAAEAPAGRVAIARCHTYGPELHESLSRMLDQLGGAARLVRGKTVTMKINLTGSPTMRMGTVPAEKAQYTHPAVIGSLIRLLGDAGARRIQVVEGCFSSDEPLEEFLLAAGWDPALWATAAERVIFENTNTLGRGKRYARFLTPGGGHLFPGFDLNHAYADCDVVVSVAKLKEHATCGVTLGMKNMFGATPLTIYGDYAGREEPDESAARSGRVLVMHQGQRPPSKSAPQPREVGTPRDDKWRMPRIVADLAAALPVHLTVIDGIDTMAGGEGPWIRGVRPVHPGLLIAGLNPVCTDAVAAACMGFNPMAGRGTAPFEKCDSFLELAEQLGVGTRNLARIEVAGVPVEKARFPFRS